MNQSLIKELSSIMGSELKYFNTCIDGNASNLEYLTLRLITPYHLAMVFNNLKELVDNSAFVDVEDSNGDIHAAINPNLDILRLSVSNTKREIIKKYAEFWKTDPNSVLESMKMWLNEIWEEDEKYEELEQAMLTNS